MLGAFTCTQHTHTHHTRKAPWSSPLEQLQLLHHFFTSMSQPVYPPSYISHKQNSFSACQLLHNSVSSTLPTTATPHPMHAHKREITVEPGRRHGGAMGAQLTSSALCFKGCTMSVPLGAFSSVFGSQDNHAPPTSQHPLPLTKTPTEHPSQPTL